MGIGTYESLQYIQELGGKMTVDSQEGEGTLVTLLLPLLDVRATGRNILGGDGA
jgi:signal transduction histidine kinase